MALDTKVGSFLKPASTTGTQDITGVGFAPKVLIVWGVGGLVSGTWASDAFPQMGFAVGNSADDQRCIGSRHNDNAAAANNHRIGDDKLICQVSSGGAIGALAELTSFNEDGFTINWITNASANQYIYHYLALGGDDITDRNIVQWTTPTSVGPKAVTGVGFQPDFLMHLYYQGTAFGGVAGAGVAMAVSVAAAHTDPNVGDSPDVSARTVMWSAESASDPTVANRLWAQQQVRTIDFDGTDDHETDRTASSFDADGFTIDFDAVTGSPYAVATLCLKGPQFWVQNYSKDNSGVDPTAESFTGIGFQPEAIFVMGTTQNTPPAASVVDGHAVFGASDGTTEGFATFFDDAGLATSDCQALSKTDKFFGGTTTIGTLDFEGDVTSFDADGFSVSWSTNDTAARRIVVAAFASAEEGGEEPPPEPPPEEPLPTVTPALGRQPNWSVTLRRKFDLEQLGQLFPFDSNPSIPLRYVRWGRNIRALRQVEFSVHPSHPLASELMTLHNWVEVRREGDFEALFLITDFALDMGGFTYQRSSLDACSSAWVGGGGEGRDRRVIYRDDPSVEAELGRVEKFVSRTDVEYREVGKLREAGDHFLAQQNASLLGVSFAVGEEAEAVESLTVRAMSATQVLTHRPILPDAGTLKLGPAPLDRILRDNLAIFDGGGTPRHTLSFTYECSGPNRLVLVVVHTREDASQSASVIYGTQGMTFRVRAENANAATEIWSLTNPDIGEQLVTITLAGSEEYLIAAEVISYNGVDQTTAVSGATGATGYSDQPSVTVPAAPAGTIVVMFAEAGAEAQSPFDPTSSIVQEIFQETPDSAGPTMGFWRYGRGPSFSTTITAKAAEASGGGTILASWAAAGINVRRATPSTSARALDHLNMTEDMDTEFGSANAVMRKYVTNNLINPRDSARILVPPLVLGADTEEELDLVHKGGRFEPVLDMLQEIATEKDVGFEVTLDPDTDNSLLFDLIPITDKTNTVHLIADVPLEIQPYKYREHWDIGDRITVDVPTLGLSFPIVVWDVDVTLAPGLPDQIQLGLQTNLRLQDAMRNRLRDIVKRH